MLTGDSSDLEEGKGVRGDLKEIKGCRYNASENCENFWKYKLGKLREYTLVLNDSNGKEFV